MEQVSIELEEYKELLRCVHEVEAVSRYVAAEKYPRVEAILGILRIQVSEQEE